MNLRIASLVLVGALASSGLVACKKSTPAQGPAEQAGENVDNAAKKTKNAVKEGANDAADAVEDTAEDAKKKTK